MAHKQKVILTIFGLIIAMMLLEIALRTAGFIYKHYRINNHKREADAKDGSIKILCLGDSFTFGEGAPKGYSYPEQLQKMLDNKPNKKYIAYNAGIGGQNSSQIFKKLENNIQEYGPDVVIVMTGVNNNSIFLDSNYFLFKDRSLKTYLYRMDAFLSNIKSYKLLRSAIIAIRSNIEHKTDKYNKDNFFRQQAHSKNIIKDVSDEFKKEAEKHLASAKVYESERKIDFAIAECKKSIKLNPYDDKSYFLLGYIYLNRCQDLDEKTRLHLAIDNFKKARDINPLSESIHDNLFNAYYRIGERQKAEEELVIWHTLNPKNEIVNALLVHGSPEYHDMNVFRMTLAYDLNNIINLLNSKNIKLVLMNYPASWVNSDLKEIAARSKTVFVDNQAVFKQKQAADGYRREDYFAEDGHCNANGYKIMAENVYNELLKR